MNENAIEGRNAVIEAFRAGKTIDKLYVQDGLKDGPIQTILREAKKRDVKVNFVEKDRLNGMSATGHHQGVIAIAASYSYAEVEDILAKAAEKGEPPFIIILDGVEDPYNLGADRQRCPDLCRRPELHACGEGHKHRPHHGRPEEAGTVVRLRGHGRHSHVRPGPDRAYRPCDRE